MSKLSELFQRVHDRFIDNDTDNPYICCNIEFDTIAKPYLKKKAIRIISRRLGNSHTYCSWLRENHNEIFEQRYWEGYCSWLRENHNEIFEQRYWEGFRQGRILWLKSLVEEFK